MMALDDCIFCKIAAGQIPSRKVYEDDTVLAFEDVNPQAKVHVLVVPKTHYTDILDISRRGIDDLGAMMRGVGEVVRAKGLEKNGFRLVNNCGSDGCQSVKHVHIHVLGGEQLSEKMS